jgi:RNA polymerase sigma-70 factor (ECF subfamily)
MSASSNLQHPAGTSSEDDLIRRVLSGRHELFYELVRPYERRVYLTAFAILQNEADAEDIAQEAILKAFRGLNGFRGEAKFSTWLLRITMNEARMRLRGQRWDHVSISAEEEEGEYTPLLLRDWREIPSEVLERKEVREQIEKGLGSLSKEYREIFVLRDIQGLNVAETASVLGISIGLVKIRLLRARLRMRDFLAPLLRRIPQEHKDKKGGKLWS